jgi:hypothetical protein
MIIAGIAAIAHFTRIKTIPPERNVDVADGDEVRAVCHRIVPLDMRPHVGG